MFLDITDYEEIIQPAILTQILQGNDSNRIKAELVAQSIMEDYLRAKYDVAIIFATTGSARHKTLVRYMMDIAIYELHARIQSNMVPQLRIDRYDEAMRWLKDVRDGKISPNLPRLLDENNAPKKTTFLTSASEKQNFDF